MVRPSTVSSLSAARLAVPRAAVRLIARDRLTALVEDQVRAHPVTLVTGGAGTGKTLAVAQWAAGRARPVAWVSVDRAIRTPRRLWAAVVTAVRLALPTGATSAVGPDPWPGEGAVVDDDVAEALAAALDEEEVCVVLDDVHELDRGDAWEAFDRLLRNVPDGLRLVLVARHDPPLALHRLRVSGQLGEVRAADLAFTEAEAGALLADRGIVLPAVTLGELMTTTQGWAAGLRMAVMTLEVAEDPVGAVAEFGGGQRLVTGYLLEEVLTALGPERGEFLYRTSVVDRICGPLARALTGDRSAEARLAALAADNALVVELPGSGWYRYHPLMLQMLRTRMRAEQPDLQVELHRRASAWLESGGEWLAALEHAVAAEDWDLAGVVSLRSAAVQMFTADRAAFAAVIDRVPPDEARARPELEVARAVAAFCRRDHDRETALRARAGPLVAELPEPRRSVARLSLKVLEASAARREGDARAMAAAAAEAAVLVGGLGEDEAPGWSVYRGAPQAVAAIGELWSGHADRAAGLLQGASLASDRLAPSAYEAVYHLGHLALAQVAAGRVLAARRTATAALADAERAGVRVRHESGAAWLALAAAEVLRGDPAAAGRAVEFGRLAVDHGPDPFVGAALRVVAARRAVVADDLGLARQHITEVGRRLTAHPGMTLLRWLRTAIEVEIDLAAGDVRRAEELLAQFDIDVGRAPGEGPLTPDVIAVPRARVLVAAGRAEGVRPTVAHLLDKEGFGGAEAWLVTCLAEDRLRHDSAATQALARALDLAAREDCAYPFLRPGDRLASMLDRHLDVVGTHPVFVRRVLETAARPGDHASPGTLGSEALTDRELSVLAYLPTMSSNAEIAERLGVSVNTVKHHLKAIHRKLGVSTRRDAVRVARRFALLPERAEQA